VRQSDLCARHIRAFITSILSRTESASSNGFNWKRELGVPKLSAIVKAADFPVQAPKELANIWTEVELIGENYFDPIRKPQRFRCPLNGTYLI
jgi:hypothetical protein